jgi:U3 small nucleolar RNA-associated protein 7
MNAEFGPYTMDFTSSGQYMAVAGRKGHLAIVDMKNLEVRKEFQVCPGTSKLG